MFIENYKTIDRIIFEMQGIDINETKMKLLLVSFASIGALKTLKVAYKSCKALVKYFVIPRRNLA